MPLVLVAGHLVAIGLATMAGRRSMASGLYVAAIMPVITAIWAAVLLISGNTNDTSELVWVEGLDLGFRFTTTPLTLLMVLLVSGIGSGVFVYATGYFGPNAKYGTRFPATLLAFSTSMLGLVLADSIWTFFIFWELTTVTSFLLVGHKHQSPVVQAAARRALAITGAGGLVLLAGLLVLGIESGTPYLSELTPISGGAATTAAILILVGAATKSAQFPFHVWLPGAMMAPTPVSAYLHSATMVKAGVLLVAVVSPSFVDNATWNVLGLFFGVTSIFWGAIGALRQTDGKLILAWGTVSQLGLMITLLSLGSGKAIFAGISLLFAHALFKAALFLVIGEVDIRTGTREINELGGLNRSMPVSCGVAVVAGLSMMGAPPLMGFLAKEAAIEAALGKSGLEFAVAMLGVVGGSVLTVAYTVRFIYGVFGPSDSGELTEVAPRRLAMTIPAVILGFLSFAGYVFANLANNIVIPAAVQLNPDAAEFELIRWPGIKTAFVISIAILVVGGVVGSTLVKRAVRVPDTVGANNSDRILDGILDAAPRLTGSVQHGSLPVYLATMTTAVIISALPFLTDLSFDHLELWDAPAQGALAIAIIVAGFGGGLVNSRLGAALSLGAVGTGVTALFVVQGAPDLALTQLLVETVIVVGFVTGLGHLARRFPESTDAWKSIRVVIAVLGGLAVMGALVASGANPSGSVPIDELTQQAVEVGGGNNIVNVILTDIRGLDTLGEVVVLATVALGMLALARTPRPRANAEGSPS